MHTSIFALSLFFIVSLAHSKPYGQHDMKRVLTVSESPAGKKQNINIKHLDQVLDDLALHARSYPPQFDTQPDKQRAIQDVKTLSGMLDVILKEPNPSAEFLWRAGFLNSMGHNLDIPGSAEKAAAQFEKLLAASPSDPRGNYLYGAFLAGAGKSKEALPYLKKAISAGLTYANYTAGVAHLSLGDKENALIHLEAYKRQHPKDGKVTQLIDGIRSGKVKIKGTTN